MSATDQDRVTEHRLRSLETIVSALQKAGGETERRVTIQEVSLTGVKEAAKEFVTRQEFTPTRMIVYGLAATALTGLLSAILSKLFVS